jgi:glyoxylase-like metal-dependent hydrolase (beta-lactamase superfamily II)
VPVQTQLWLAGVLEMSEFVASRRVGDATVTVISEGSMPWAPRFQISEDERRLALPDADAGGRIILGLNLVHIRVPDASILVDPGCDDPTSSWQQHFAMKFPGIRRSPGLRAGLARLGVAPEAVTHVVITHAHSDHFSGVTVEQDGVLAPRFPKARHMIGRGDWDENPARREPTSDLAVRLGLIDRLGMLCVVGGEHEVTPNVTVLPAPGETPGHMLVRLRSAHDSFYYLGDLFHHASEVEHIEWNPPGRDQAALRASRERLIAEAVQHRAVLVFTHARFPAWGKIVRAGGGYRWERAG